MKHPKDKDVYFKLDATDEAILVATKQVHRSSPLEQALMNVLDDLDSDEEDEIGECLKELDDFDDLDSEVKLELKTLPSHL
ncbi:hypothetical protein A2U01_0068191, partial [Trifolium medium]|nr:hypothetical protein [Trifolium medium]